MNLTYALPLAATLALSATAAIAAQADPTKGKPEMAVKKVAANAATPDRTAAADTAARPGSAVGRDWAAIDTNKDNLVSPDEMTAYLQANPGPLRPK